MDISRLFHSKTAEAKKIYFEEVVFKVKRGYIVR